MCCKKLIGKVCLRHDLNPVFEGKRLLAYSCERRRNFFGSRPDLSRGGTLSHMGQPSGTLNVGLRQYQIVGHFFPTLTRVPSSRFCGFWLHRRRDVWGKCSCSVVEGNGWDGWRDAFCLFAQLLYCWTTFEWNLFLLQEILLDGKTSLLQHHKSVGCVHVCAYGGGGIWEKLPGRQSWRFSAFCQAKESLTFVGFSLSKIVSNFSG